MTIQKVIRLALSNEGYDIQAVSDGNDAIQQIAVFRPDVVLIDVSLPGKSAFEVKKATDAESHSVRFVLMSSAFERVDEQQIQQLHFHGQLTKPFDPAHLRKVLSDVLATTQESPSAAAPVPPQVPAPVPPQTPAQAPMEPPPPLPELPSATSEEGTIELSLPPLPSFPPLPESPQEPASPMETLDAPPEAFPQDFPELPPDEVPLSPDLPSFDPPIESPVDSPTLPPTSQNTPPRMEDSDIRHLTESTIRMSGLDDFDWSVKEPTLKPSAEIGDISHLNFPFDESDREPHGFDEASILSNSDIPPAIKMTHRAAGDDTGIRLTLDDQDSPQIIGSMPPMPGSSSSPGISPQISPQVSKEAIEEMIRKEVQQALEKVAERILPEVAERVIKQEIHRLLSESS